VESENRVEIGEIWVDLIGTSLEDKIKNRFKN
jgi:hypothetical protein